MGALVTLMLVVGAALIWNLQTQTRELAKDHPELRDRYATLPFGVPEGTVRGLVSLMIIIVGLGVLIVQEPLGIESSEAVAGFISAVIAFYFVTREQAASNNALRSATSALQAATQGLTGSPRRPFSKSLSVPDLKLVQGSPSFDDVYDILIARLDTLLTNPSLSFDANSALTDFSVDSPAKLNDLTSRLQKFLATELGEPYAKKIEKLKVLDIVAKLPATPTGAQLAQTFAQAVTDSL